MKEDLFPGFTGKCSICDRPIPEHKTPEGKVFWKYGHNAEPVNSGRCCDDCNSAVVIPARLQRIYQR